MALEHGVHRRAQRPPRVRRAHQHRLAGRGHPPMPHRAPPRPVADARRRDTAAAAPRTTISAARTPPSAPRPSTLPGCPQTLPSPRRTKCPRRRFGPPVSATKVTSPERGQAKARPVPRRRRAVAFRYYSRKHTMGNRCRSWKSASWKPVSCARQGQVLYDPAEDEITI